MSNLVRAIYLESQVGAPTLLPTSGTWLENPYVYDSAARELKAMADKGLVEIVGVEWRHDTREALIGRISFARVR